MASAINNLILLQFLFSLSAYRHPNNLVMIKSSTEIITVTKTESKLIRAMESICKEISSKHKDANLIELLTKELTNMLYGSGGKEKEGEKEVQLHVYLYLFYNILVTLFCYSSQPRRKKVKQFSFNAVF